MYKVGDKVRVIANTSEHQYPIGYTSEIEFISDEQMFLGMDDRGYTWTVRDSEIELIERSAQGLLASIAIKSKKEAYFEFAENFYKQALEISRAKNRDYTGDADDPFANFKSVEILGISTEVGFLTRMMDKMKRIASFVEKGELAVKDESVQDTLHDLCNYCCLMAGYLHSKKKLPEPPNEFKKSTFLCLDETHPLCGTQCDYCKKDENRKRKS